MSMKRLEITTGQVRMKFKTNTVLNRFGRVCYVIVFVDGKGGRCVVDWERVS